MNRPRLRTNFVVEGLMYWILGILTTRCIYGSQSVQWGLVGSFMWAEN